MKPILITVAVLSLLGAVIVNHAAVSIGLLFVAAAAGYAGVYWKKKEAPRDHPPEAQ